MQINKTQLLLEYTLKKRGIKIHRDYIAHVLRWTHVVKVLNDKSRYKLAQILEIGCGKELPLVKLLYINKFSPKSYTGVDANELVLDEVLQCASKKFPIYLHGGSYFPDVKLKQQKYNIIVCLEVYEHLDPVAGYTLLQGIKSYMDASTIVFISTSCYDAKVGAAGNHINEISYNAFGALLEHVGFTIERNFGTFASIRDYKDKLAEHGLVKTFDLLKAYYDVDYLATIFAPLFPACARNNLWELSLNKKKLLRNTFPALSTCVNVKHSSNQGWGDFVQSVC